MTSGIYINGRRPKSKKEVKEAVQANPHKVRLEGTDFMGKEYDGRVDEMPEGQRIPFVGPDPFLSRKFYGTIIRYGEKVRVE